MWGHTGHILSKCHETRNSLVTSSLSTQKLTSLPILLHQTSKFQSYTLTQSNHIFATVVREFTCDRFVATRSSNVPGPMAPRYQQLSGLADICTCNPQEPQKLQRICGFDSPPAVTDSSSDEHSEAATCASRSVSVPESPLAVELKQAGLIGMPALPKLGVRLGTRKGSQGQQPGVPHRTRGSRSCQNLASLADAFCPPTGPSGPAVRAHSSGDADTGSGTSLSSQHRSSPIDTPRCAAKDYCVPTKLTSHLPDVPCCPLAYTYLG